MAAKLNQLIAIENGTKTRAHEAITEAHKLLQRGDLFNGHARRYRSKDDEGEKVPDEDKAVTHRASQLISDAQAKLIELFDVTAMRDYANGSAKADVVVGERVLLKDVPVTYLLFLEKKLVDIHTFVKKLPTLALGEEWTKNEAQDLYASKPVESIRTKKVSRPLILAEATKEHPAQVKEIVEDLTVGFWTTTKYSSALPVTQVNAILARVEDLQKAVKFAREKANEAECKKVEIGKTVFDFIFAG